MGAITADGDSSAAAPLVAGCTGSAASAVAAAAGDGPAERDRNGAEIGEQIRERCGHRAEQFDHAPQQCCQDAVDGAHATGLGAVVVIVVGLAGDAFGHGAAAWRAAGSRTSDKRASPSSSGTAWPRIAGLVPRWSSIQAKAVEPMTDSFSVMP